ncbi:MAG TPA: hypothetical protein PKC13_16785 [Blastocatellia bacterium]|nr:hypothetical protein [Blastocatellia bacterium]
MAEHLSNETIQLYLHRELAAESRFNADIHFADCSSCRERLGEGDKLQALYQAFQADLTISTEETCRHLTDEEVLAYLKNRLGAVEMEIATSHLVWCEECQFEVKQMRIVASELDFRQGQTKRPLKQILGKAIARIRQLFQIRGLRLEYLAPLALLGAGAFLSWRYFSRQNHPAEMSQNVLQPTQNLAIVSGSPLPEITTSERGLSDTAAFSDSFKWLRSEDQALFARVREHGKLEIPKALTQQSEASMGRKQEKSFRLLGPGNVFIRGTQPTLKWEAYEDVTRYRVIVSKKGVSLTTVASVFVTGTEWKPDRPLERNYHYTWQVITQENGKDIYGFWQDRPVAEFFVIGEDELARVRQAEKNYQENTDPMARIALATRYAKAGLVEDAKRELKNFPTEHPQAARP